MILLALSGLAMVSASTATTSAPAPLHQATVQHASLPVNATYRAAWHTTTHEIDPKPVQRQALPYCRWQASLVVNREVTGRDGRPVAALAKPIHTAQPISGFEMGRCDAVKGKIDAKIARAAQSAETLAAAQGDHATLIAEIDSIATLAPTKG